MDRVVIFLLTLWLCTGCVQPYDAAESTYHPYSYIYEITDSRMLQLKAGWDQLRYPVLPSLFTMDSTWYFELGDPAEGLHAPVHEFDGEMVHLPHRMEYPDHPFWYKQKIALNQPGYLYVQADDGAQVYLNTKAVEITRGNFFLLDTTGTVEVTIRVLNNAMRGGLQRVAYLSVDQYKEFQTNVMDYHTRKQLIRRVLLKKNLPKHWLDLAEKALASDNRNPVNQLTRELMDYPYLAGPYLMKHGDSVKLMVIGEGAQVVALEWGSRSDKMDRKLSMPGPIARFELGILDKTTTYYYRISSVSTHTATMRILPQRLDSFTFNVWADSQSGWDGFAQSVKIMKESHDAFGIGLGDLVANGSDSLQWLQFLSMLSLSAGEVPYYLVAGNHDYDGYYDDLVPRHYDQYTANKTSYQSWRFGHAAFIALDPNCDFPIGIKAGDKQYEWFQQQLNSEIWKRATWRFIVLHQPPFSQGWAGYEGEKVIRDLLEPVIESAKIDFVVSGHTHDYERLVKSYGSQQVTFLIVGGAGGNLEERASSSKPEMDVVVKAHHIGRFYVERNKLVFTAIGHGGQILDSIALQKK